MVTIIKAKTIGNIITSFPVLNETIRAKSLGIDWKTQYNQLKYPAELFMLSEAFKNYDELNVTEMLSGYIFNKQEIEDEYFAMWENYIPENVGLGGAGEWPVPDLVNLVYIDPLKIVI